MCINKGLEMLEWLPNHSNEVRREATFKIQSTPHCKIIKWNPYMQILDFAIADEEEISMILLLFIQKYKIHLSVHINPTCPQSDKAKLLLYWENGKPTEKILNGRIIIVPREEGAYFPVYPCESGKSNRRILLLRKCSPTLLRYQLCERHSLIGFYSPLFLR